MARFQRLFVCLLLGSLLVTLMPAVNAGASPEPIYAGALQPVDPQASLEQQLAERFAPIAFLRQQTAACDRDGEGYVPAPVDVVLGNPDIALKQHDTDASKSDTIVMMGPTAQDLAGKDDSYYLDFPGNPRHPGCTYETAFKRYAAAQSVQPSTYARIVIDDEKGVLVLQYWFWYYFNDWNNTHESDWEMIQLVFETTSVADALAGEPAWVGFAQHGGGETADWSDDKLGRDGDHVFVYPGAGSHGTYYGEDVFIGWGENGTGFGCDNSDRPTIRTPLTPILIPDTIDPNGPFAWLLFGGRWGEHQPWEYNGPEGPNLKDKWVDPVLSMEDWRESSLSAPGGSNTALGPSATDLFCTLSKSGSMFIMQVGTQPKLFIGLVVGALIAIGLFLYNKRRTIGDAYAFYVRHFRTFMLIGLVALPIGLVFNGVQFVLRVLPPFDWVIRWFNDTTAARLVASSAAGTFQQIVMTLVIAPPVIQTVRDIRSGLKPDLRRSFSLAYQHLPTLAVALVVSTVAVGLLTFIVIGIPIAIILGIRWQFFGQATILDGASNGREALDTSRRAITGRTWQAFTDALVFQVLAIIPGPLVGAILMVLGKASVDFANLFASVVYAITIPISTIGLTFAYMRYRDRKVPIPTMTPGAADTPLPEVGTANA